MEQLFNDLQQQISGSMADVLALTDEDYGQLEALVNGEAQYPLTFPCVLISIPETLWDNVKTGPQHGKTTVCVRLAFSCGESSADSVGAATTVSSSTSAAAIRADERLRLAARLNRLLQGWQFEGCASVLVRRATRQYSKPGGIKVYEVEYATTMNDAPATE